MAIAAYYHLGDSLNLSFPLRSGTYYVLQGGNGMITNPFHAMGGSRLAMDFVKLNRFGNRADGIAASSLDSYAIYGEKLYSPCTGKVMLVRDGLPDNAPGNPDIENPAGNHLVMKCGEAQVFLAHLKSGSVATHAEDRVTVGQLLGKVGNSGNTLEPHLHVSATANGAEKGIRFDGKSLSVNSLITRK